MKSSWTCRKVLTVAIIGLLTIGVGLVFAYLSNPVRFSENVHDDLAINSCTGAALLSTLIGGIIFLKAISQTITAMPSKPRRDINLGFAAGFVMQVSALTSHDPASVAFGFLAWLPFYCWASMRFAEAKGLSTSFGALGLLGVVGLIVLLLLPTQTERSAPQGTDVSSCSISQSQATLAIARDSASLRRSMASMAGVFVGTPSAVVIGETVSLIALFPPLNHWLDFDREFSGICV